MLYYSSSNSISAFAVLWKPARSSFFLYLWGITYANFTYALWLDHKQYTDWALCSSYNIVCIFKHYSPSLSPPPLSLQFLLTQSLTWEHLMLVSVALVCLGWLVPMASLPSLPLRSPSPQREALLPAPTQWSLTPAWVRPWSLTFGLLGDMSFLWPYAMRQGSAPMSASMPILYHYVSAMLCMWVYVTPTSHLSLSLSLSLSLFSPVPVKFGFGRLRKIVHFIYFSFPPTELGAPTNLNLVPESSTRLLFTWDVSTKQVCVPQLLLERIIKLCSLVPNKNSLMYMY